MGDTEEPGTAPRHEIDRRTALKLIGGTTAGLAMVPRLALPVPAPSSRYALAFDRSLRQPLLGGLRSLVAGAASPSLVFQAIRTEDMLYLGFEFYNAKATEKAGQTYLVAENSKLPMTVVVVFPAQHFGEQSVEFTSGMTTWPTPPLHAALAGFSWLAFEVPGTAEVPYTIDGLLAWTAWKPELVPVVTDPATGSPAAPDPVHTALEVPWSLWLSPLPNGTWHHATAPVTSFGRTELWHTRLGVKALEPPTVTPYVKAFWSRTYDSSPFAPPPPDPWFMSLDPEARNDIVLLTTTTAAGGGPAAVNLFALSALGASINVQGSWTPGGNTPVSLTQWTHRTSVGRDSYVRTAFLGYLFPFGHRAVRIEITDREFQVDSNRDVVAYLVTKEYIVVTEPVVTYAGDPDEPHEGRGNPIRRIEVKTITTPPIDFDTSVDPGIEVKGLASDTDYVLWVRSGLKDIPYSFVATDVEGRTVDFTTSIIWLDETYANSVELPTIITGYDAGGAARTSPSFGGNAFAFAETAGSTPGSTVQHVNTYTLTAAYASNGRNNFYPLLESAVVHLPGAEQLVGAGSHPLSAPSVAISSNYLHSGFEAGVTEIYLAVNKNGPGLNFPVSLVGGMAAPNLDVSGIARDLGPVAGELSDLLAGKFDPAKYFSVLSGAVGNLLGAINIAGIIQSVPLPPGPRLGGTPAANGQAPQISSNFVYPNNDDSKPPTALDTKLTWNPQVTEDPTHFFQPSNDANLLITAEIYAPIANPSQTTYTIHGELTNFELVLFGDDAYIGISFTSFTFDSKTGAKTSIQPKIESVTFLGPLTFIQDLEQLLSSLGGPTIDVTAAGIDASYTLALPDISVGIFSLSNLSISGGVNIPFDGTPVRVRFALCSQDNPFQLTIYVFGGGGFFALAVGADGIEEIQVELEFGAAISINLGVASGGVSIMAGIYFSLQTTPTQAVQLTGFLRADGNLSILGIITMSMEFYLGLTYLNPGQSYGEATVSVSISVLFFSASVSATMQKTFGGGSDPDFKDAISRKAWDTYCEAFAS